MLSQQIEMVEANLRRLALQLDDVPIQEVLLCRMMLFLGHEVALMLDHHVRPFGLGEAEFRVLSTLFSQAGHMAHPGDLCASASQSPANMSRICDALVSRDLITRDLCAQDRRKLVLRITPKGERLVRDLLPTLFQATRGTFRGFSESDRQLLIDQLKRLAAHLDEGSESPIDEKLV
jgi:DNA-binding MarR family transcriptional regulator